MSNFQDKVSFIWSVAELLRGDFKQSEYGKIVLTFTVLRRLDCFLETNKEKDFGTGQDPTRWYGQPVTGSHAQQGGRWLSVCS